MFYLLHNNILVLREISKMSSRFVRKEKSLKETGVKSKSEKAAQIYSFLSVWGRLERKRAGRSFSEIDWSANRQLEESATLQWQRQDVGGRPITSKGCAGSANSKARMTSPAVTHPNTNTNTNTKNGWPAQQWHTKLQIQIQSQGCAGSINWKAMTHQSTMWIVHIQHKMDK